ETVRTHVKKIYKKLHVASAQEAVAKAIRQRLI
ncbi:MAG TPA: LuxR C-terminal-related transcriptional regulator, partial [Chitinophagaceae bacterium]|nr:LuxR C-terminal-related transcriptional regulator [Chitinophagaceae bacterium]